MEGGRETQIFRTFRAQPPIDQAIAARTQFDLAEVVTRRELERVFDQAEVMEVFDLTAIKDQIQRNPTRPAAAIVQSILEEHYIGRTPTRSELEEAGLAMSRACE